VTPKNILISRTDSIGDVVLTLPMCGVLKKHFPNVKIFFLGRAYTQAIIERCEHVDQYINWDAMKEKSPAAQIAQLQALNADTVIHVFPRKEVLWLAKRAGIPVRIATGRRINTLTKCNKLVFFTRKGSPLHEAQLNLKLLKPLGIDKEYSLEELGELYAFTRKDSAAEQRVTEFLSPYSSNKKKVVLHPLSKGSAAEWSLENYQRLTTLLPKEQFDIFITGTKDEGEKIQSSHPIKGEHVHDVTGKFNLTELIAFIDHCDALVAASTGPLHIAAALGKKAIGLYSPKRPIHPGRWAPVGKDAHVIVADAHPPKGEKLAIAPERVAALL
jgi:heptosyltransferase-3